MKLENGQAILGSDIAAERGLAGPEGLIFVGGNPFQAAEDHVVTTDGIDINGLQGGDINPTEKARSLGARADEGEEAIVELAEQEGAGLVAELNVGEELTVVEAPDAEDFGDGSAADGLAFAKEQGTSAVPDAFVGGRGAFGEGGPEKSDGAADASDTREGAEEFASGDAWRRYSRTQDGAKIESTGEEESVKGLAACGDDFGNESDSVAIEDGSAAKLAKDFGVGDSRGVEGRRTLAGIGVGDGTSVGEEKQTGIVFGVGGRRACGAGFESVENRQTIIGPFLLEDFGEGGKRSVAKTGDGDTCAGDHGGRTVVVENQDAIVGAVDSWACEGALKDRG